ncbi:MAG: YhcH/YjgK/YiaL family protein [Phycisphaeraceae bacterium]
MILDHLSKYAAYAGLAPRLMRALCWLNDANLADLALGRHDLDGDNLFALVEEYDTRPVDQCKWEAHRKYMDVQYVIAGVERMGWAGLAAMREVTPYDAQKDLAFYQGQGDFVTVHAGMFAIFMPQDVHMPVVAPGMITHVRKIVIKAAV